MGEFVGTSFLVLCGCRAIVIGQVTNGAVTPAGIAITFGLVVMSLIYALGDLSGAHLNPAVSIAFTLAKKIPASCLLPYIISQLGVAIAVGLTLKMLFPTNLLLLETIPASSNIQSFIHEGFLLFLLMFVIMKVAHGHKETGMFAGIAIGSIIAQETMFTGSIYGASMNPAKPIGSAIASDHLEHLWVYGVGPTLSAALSLPLYNYLKTESLTIEKTVI